MVILDRKDYGKAVFPVYQTPIAKVFWSVL